jgi:transketolase
MADWGGPSDGNTRPMGDIWTDEEEIRQTRRETGYDDEFFELNDDWQRAEEERKKKELAAAKAFQRGVKAAKKAQRLAEPRESFLQRMKTKIAGLFGGRNNAFGSGRKYHKRSRHGYRGYYNASH